MKRKRRPAADKPGMRYARILTAIDKAEKEIRRANARLTALRVRQTECERRLGVDRVDEIKARRLTQTLSKTQTKTTKAEARKALMAAQELAYHLAKPEQRVGILLGSVHSHEFRRSADTTYHGWVARMPCYSWWLWHPVKGYGSVTRDQGLGNTVWYGKHLPE
jgi:hypothetical protein